MSQPNAAPTSVNPNNLNKHVSAHNAERCWLEPGWCYRRTMRIA